MRGHSLAAISALALSACKEAPITAAELAAYAAENPDVVEKVDPAELKVAAEVIENSSKLKEVLGVFIDLRDPDQVEYYENHPKYKGFQHTHRAYITDNGAISISYYNPITESVSTENDWGGITMHETGYSLDTEEGRRVLKVEQGNLLKAGEEDSNAMWTTVVDVESGVITSVDDGGGLNEDGFILVHNEEGNLVKEEEKFFDAKRAQFTAMGAIEVTKTLAQKLDEKEREECWSR